MTFRTLFITAATGALLGLFPPNARSGCDDDRSAAARLAAGAPAEADVVLAIVNASELRADAFGGAAVPLLTEALRGSELGAAWVALAQRMGWSPDATFDALLGERVLFVAKRNDGKAMRWAVAADVSLDAERRLRERLDVAPRVIVGGKPILSVEQGRFELISERSRHGARIILAPAGERGMLDEVALTARRNTCAKRLAEAPEFDDLARMPPGQALLFVRMPEPIGGWAGLSAKCEDTTISAHVLTRPERSIIGAAEVAPWSRAVFDRFAHGALAAVMEWRAGADDIPELCAPLVGLLPPLDDHPGALDALGERYAVVVRQRDNGAPTVSAAIELRDAGAFAPTGDAIIERLLSRLGLSATGIATMTPDTTRTVDLAPGLERLAKDASAVAHAITLAGASVSWAFRSEAHDLVAFGGETPGAGWWIVALDGKAFEHAAIALCGGAVTERGDARKWLSLGTARPSDLIEALDRVGARGLTTGAGRLAGALRALGHVDRVDWSTELISDNEQASEVVVRLRPAP